MRQLILLLVFLNIMFFGLNVIRGEKTRVDLDTRLKQPDGVPSILLLSEHQAQVASQVKMEGPEGVEPDTLMVARQFIDDEADNTLTENTQRVIELETPALVDGQVPDEAEKAQITSVCITLGPVENESDLGMIAGQLKTLEIIGSPRSEERKVENGAWLYLGPFEKKIARGKVKHLKSLGISDILLSKADQGLFKISLGVFSRESSKNDRIKELKKNKIKPSIKQRFKITRQYWFDIILNQPSFQEDALDKLLRINKSISGQSVDCQAVEIHEDIL